MINLPMRLSQSEAEHLARDIADAIALVQDDWGHLRNGAGPMVLRLEISIILARLAVTMGPQVAP